jgi:hypothetical protein
MSGAGNGQNGHAVARPARLVRFREYTKGTLIGFATVAFPSGMVIGEIAVHRQGDKAWAAPPARIRLRDGSSEPMRENGKLVWMNDLISFESVEIRRRWSASVIEAIRRDRTFVLGRGTSAAELPEASGEEAAP